MLLRSPRVSGFSARFFFPNRHGGSSRYRHHLSSHGSSLRYQGTTTLWAFLDAKGCTHTSYFRPNMPIWRCALPVAVSGRAFLSPYSICRWLSQSHAWWCPLRTGQGPINTRPHLTRQHSGPVPLGRGPLGQVQLCGGCRPLVAGVRWQR